MIFFTSLAAILLGGILLYAIPWWFPWLVSTLENPLKRAWALALDLRPMFFPVQTFGGRIRDQTVTLFEPVYDTLVPLIGEDAASVATSVLMSMVGILAAIGFGVLSYWTGMLIFETLHLVWLASILGIFLAVGGLIWGVIWLVND
jgi:hypothetical protein